MPNPLRPFEACKKKLFRGVFQRSRAKLFADLVYSIQVCFSVSKQILKERKVP